MAVHDTIDPTSGEVIESHDVMTRDEAEAALQAAEEGFQQWRRVPVAARAEIVARIADVLGDREQELAELTSLEMGKRPGAAAGELQLVRMIAQYEAEQGPRLLADRDEPLHGGRAVVTHQPIGLVLGIAPWNFPYYQAARFSLANLVAGNVPLLKHAPNVWGSAKALIAAFHEAGVPSDAFVGLYTDDATTESLIGHPLVRAVNFTGSAEVGAAVASAAGRHRKKTVLELGSNDAYLVLSDADLGIAVPNCVAGRTMNAGQTCIAAKRIIVTANHYDEFRDAFVERMAALRIGHPRADDVDLGPLARGDLRDALHQQVVASVEAGATLTLGGVVPDGPGWFYPPTVLEDVAPGQPAYHEELFGPVAALIRVADDDEALRVANDSRYGLSGGIFSADVDRALRLAREEFTTGSVNINGFRGIDAHLPFGGVKDSGYGREHGGLGVLEFVNTKTVRIAEPQGG